jgi:preprotein translocase subunit YajC
MLDCSIKNKYSCDVGNVCCTDKISCLQLLFEHELTHILLKIFIGEYVINEEGDHGPTFRALLYKFFKHTDIDNQLVKRLLVFIRDNTKIKKGDYVQLQNIKKGIKYFGESLGEVLEVKDDNNIKIRLTEENKIIKIKKSDIYTKLEKQ